MATGSPTYRTRPTAIGQHSTGALTPTTRPAVSALTFSPSRTAMTPGARFATEDSIDTISACACGERRIAALSVPGRTPRSSMKRPRPVSSAASSTRGIDRPTHGEPGCSLPANEWLTASAIPNILLRTEHPPAHFECVWRRYSAAPGTTAIPTNLETYHRVSFYGFVRRTINSQAGRPCESREGSRRHGYGRTA